MKAKKLESLKASVFTSSSVLGGGQGISATRFFSVDKLPVTKPDTNPFLMLDQLSIKP